MICGIEKALVFAPHPDDELNIAGQLIPSLVALGVDCRICFSTNGDFAPWDASTRHKEALKSAARLGLGQSQVFFLGYGDAFRGPHVYVEGDKMVVKSHAGHMRAYVPEGLPFSDNAGGVASPYTREAFIADIKAVVEHLIPDLIICVDYDSHPDHKALSLGFEHAMAQILSEKRSYRPVVLKKFAYASSWKGPEDYWDYAPSVKPDFIAVAYPYELPNPTYSWEERLRLAPDPSTLSTSLRANALYKAACAHKTQLAWAEVVRICNSDVVYWLRRSDNLLNEGHVSATSGDFSGIDGFTRFEVANVDSGFNVGQFLAKGWKPEDGDVARTLSVEFPDKRQLEEVRIVVSPSCDAVPDSLDILIDGRSVKATRNGLTCCYGLTGLGGVCKRIEIRLRKDIDLSVEAIELYGTPTGDCMLLKRLKTVLSLADDVSMEDKPTPLFPSPRFRLSAMHAHVFIARYLVRLRRRIRKLAYIRNADSGGKLTA